MMLPFSCLLKVEYTGLRSTYWWNINSSSQDMLRSELPPVSKGLQLSGFSCLFAIFIFILEGVWEAQETPSHPSLLLYPLITHRSSRHWIKPCELHIDWGWPILVEKNKQLMTNSPLSSPTHPILMLLHPPRSFEWWRRKAGKVDCGQSWAEGHTRLSPTNWN